jgi:hypothetical protein
MVVASTAAAFATCMKLGKAASAVRGQSAVLSMTGGAPWFWVVSAHKFCESSGCWTSLILGLNLRSVITIRSTPLGPY